MGVAKKLCCKKRGLRFAFPKLFQENQDDGHGSGKLHDPKNQLVVGRLPFVRIAHAESIDCCMTGFLSLNTPTQAISLFFGLVAASRTPLGILRSNLPNNGSLYPRYSEIFFPKLMVDCMYLCRLVLSVLSYLTRQQKSEFV